MIRFIFPIIAFLYCFSLTAQANNSAVALVLTTIDSPPTTEAVAFRPVPVFPESVGTFNTFIADYLEYPEVAVNYAIEGTVVLHVEVTAAGKVNYLHTVRTLFAPLEEAAIATIEKMPAWLPAVRNGKAVRHDIFIPFRFTLR